MSEGERERDSYKILAECCWCNILDWICRYVTSATEQRDDRAGVRGKIYGNVQKK